MSVSNGNYNITDRSITKIEVIRVREGSTVQYLSNMAFKSTSGVRTDSGGRKYVEKTCINGNVYRDYEGHALVGVNAGIFGSTFFFVAD